MYCNSAAYFFSLCLATPGAAFLARWRPNYQKIQI